jgi:YetA-like protein
MNKIKYPLLIVLLALINTFLLAQKQSIELNWLEQNAPKKDPALVPQLSGVSWGVPFSRGEIKHNLAFKLTNQSGENLPLQTWTNAFWDDGSVKWLGLATVADVSKNGFKLIPSDVKKEVIILGENLIQISDDPYDITIKNGRIACKIPKNGAILIDSLKINGQLIGTSGQLICLKQDGLDEGFDKDIKKESFKSDIKKVTIEQLGDIKTVVKIEGVFTNKERSWLPFIVRLYFYAGVENIKIVQTIIYDGQGEKDFIKGLGWEFKVPLREEILNRHIRFGGENNSNNSIVNNGLNKDLNSLLINSKNELINSENKINNIGIWSEPIQPLTGRRPLIFNKKNVYEDQFLGKRVPNKNAYPQDGQDLIKDWAVWGDFRLTQQTADGFSIQKRTHDKGAWIDATAGQRASGLVFIGDVSGGLSLNIRNFWQSFPAALEVKNAASDAAILRGWLWSPFGEAMDMRHYDTLAWGHGLNASYEDAQPGFSTAEGVARTSELTLGFHQNVPSNGELSELSHLSNNPPLLVATPQYLHDKGAFGLWSLPNRTTEGQQWIENQLDTAFLFYKNEVEQRHWYGFWNYGDVMHTYDDVRHAWRYDIGGYAWANTELIPDTWLWYSFLRTGKADIFRMAEAMTRHTSEVDVYHLGRFAGLGSRHNVRHWGCGSKEVRISQAALKRFFYYLTTDERTGELMREVVNADEAMVKIDPLRLILPKSDYPTHARVGPDWFALVGNWLTEWERTDDGRWKDKILRGVKSFAKMPYGFFSGKEGAFGYDPKTGDMFQLNPTDLGQSHLSVLMGGPEIAFEMSRFLDDKDWQRLWLQYCELYGAPKESVVKAFNKDQQLGVMSPHFCRLPAYYAYKKQDAAAAKKVWAEFLSPKYYAKGNTFNPRRINSPDVLKSLDEIGGISTNNTAQWCLNAIELLELIGKELPKDNALWQK